MGRRGSPDGSYLGDMPLEARSSFPAIFWRPLAYVSSSSALQQETGTISKGPEGSAAVWRFRYLCWNTAISSLQKFSPALETRLAFW